MENEVTGGASILFDMIEKNALNRSGTASFKSSIDRKRSTKPQAPPIGFYEYDPNVINPKSKNAGLNLSISKGREDQKSPDSHMPYKTLLDSYDYSCFKKYQGRINGIDFSKTQPR